jgi:hypothetical protein
VSISVTENRDSARALDAIHAHHDAQQRAEALMIEGFMTALQKGDANALADFAPMTTDWDAARRQPRAVGAPMPMRVQTLSEVLLESFDYANGPTSTELFQLVINLAFGNQCHACQQYQARALLARATDAYATHNAAGEA